MSQTYKATAPNGRTYEFEVPDGTSEDEISSFVQNNFAEAKGRRTVFAKGEKPTSEQMNTPEGLAQARNLVRGEPGAEDLMMQGATFGLSDEASGVGNAISNAITAPFSSSVDFDPVGAYTTGRDAERLRLDQARQSSGWGGTAAEVLGGFAGGAAPTAVGQGVTSLISAARGAARTGAIAGAVGGYGYGEGGLGSLIQSGVGALGGAAIGAALPVAGKVIANRASAVQRLVSGDRGGIARQVVGETLAQDASSPRAAGAMVQAAQDRGVPMMLADTGENARGLLASVARRPGAARTITREAVNERQGAQGDRVVGAISRDLGAIGNPDQISDDLMRNASRAAAPLYEQAYATQVDMTPELISVLETPAARQALNKARTIAANERRDPTALGFDTDEAGETILTQTPSMQTLDLVKRGLDDVLEDARDPVTRRLPLTSTTRAIQGVRQDLLSQLDQISPDYAAARAVFAGPAGQRDALMLGRASLNASADDIERATTPLNEAEREQFALGFRAAMGDNLGRAVDGADKVNRLLGTPRKRASLARLFGGSENFDQFLATMADERATNETYRSVMTGSQTAERLAADETTSDTGLIESAAGSALRRGGSVVGMLGDALKAMGEVGRFGAGQAGNETRESVAALLTETDPAVLRDLQRAIRQAAIQQRLRGRAVNRIGGRVGNVGSRAVVGAAESVSSKPGQ